MQKSFEVHHRAQSYLETGSLNLRWIRLGVSKDLKLGQLIGINKQSNFFGCSHPSAAAQAAAESIEIIYP
ncbi:MAG TPA: hypothetical protein VIZ65_14735 [Cellvibrionaceae bacterium]